jgi:hypothetical protein
VAVGEPDVKPGAAKKTSKKVTKKASAKQATMKPAMVQKKSPRRGIRLKVDDQGPGID